MMIKPAVPPPNRCVKCGGYYPSIKYMPGSIANSYRDYLMCTCGECGYEWTRLPNDAEGEAVEEAKSQPCPTCIARRGIDKCRPDEEFHVTHYDAEEMNLDPLPDKPCECGMATSTPGELCETCGRSHHRSWNCVTAARGCGGGGLGEPYGT